jgi:hypothetical protein
MEGLTKNLMGLDFIAEKNDDVPESLAGEHWMNPGVEPYN